MTGSRYPPIPQYAFLSDCHTAALVGPDAAVEWMCAPRFDGPSVLARILDRRGGAWTVDVTDSDPPERHYVETSLVLRTQWNTPSGTIVAHDFLATADAETAGERGIVAEGMLIRLVRCERGSAHVTVRLDAQPNYARRGAQWRHEGGALVTEDATLWLTGEPNPELDDGTVRVDLALRAGEATVLALGYRGDRPRAVNVATAERLLDQTVGAWRAWAGRSDYDGFAAHHVQHSAVVLRGLLFEETGALLAAPTTSLPEWLGGGRNWDYRYVWHRDAALAVLALLRLGHGHEAGRYLHFLLEADAGREDRLEPMLDIGGGPGTDEETLDHLEGYAWSQPVRIGNEAHTQHQIDTYGHILDAAFSWH